MDALKHALALKKRLGLDKALSVAESCMTISAHSLTIENALPFAQEIEYATEEYKDKKGIVRTRERIKVDPVAQTKRMRKTASFWNNVVLVLRREKRRTTAPKDS